MPIQTINYCPASLQEAGTTIDIEKIRGYHHLSHPHLPQIMGSKVKGVQCQWPNQCYHCQTGQKAPNVPDVVDNVGRLEPT